MFIYIRSMSENQTEIYRDLTSAGDQINLHILKILMFPDCKFVDHWMHEIWSFLFRVKKLKSKNKWPKEEFIRKAISTTNDMIEQLMIVVEDEESDLTPCKVDPSDALKCIENYQNWISHELSTKGVVKQSDVKTKLSEFCKI